MADHPQTVADALVRRLQNYGVRHIFGYPGGQITPIYEALFQQSTIRHILARHEQAAAFMADGYARASGRPGVCLAVCGPGVLNAATPLATAFTDSIPVLLLSGQVASTGRGPRSGYYHENDQRSACSTFTKYQAFVESPETLVRELDRAFAVMTEGRPGPVLFEVPVDILRADAARIPALAIPAATRRRAPRPQEIEALAKMVAGWRRPLILAGGGVVSAEAGLQLMQLAERLGAPVFHSLNGKSAVPSEHPLAAGLPWSRATSDLSNMAQFMSPLFDEADGLLAIGCRFTQATTGSWSLRRPAALAQIDMDAAEIGRHYPADIGICADAAEALQALLMILPPDPRVPWTQPPIREPSELAGIDLLGPMSRALPRDAILAADITRLGYLLMAEYPVHHPRTLLHPAGFVAMGYGLPAALGAKAAFPNRVVVAVAGDGCFLMSGMELASAVQEKLPVIVILVNDGSLTLIKAIQQRRYEGHYLGVDLRNPDFSLFARAFGVRSWQVDTASEVETALREAVALGETALVEVKLRGGA